MEIENKNNQYIVGSAEPLSPDDTQRRLQELEAWGVDLSLIRASLERTPTERVNRMIELLKFARELRRSYIARTWQTHTSNNIQDHLV